MSAKVDVAPALLTWARERSRRDDEYLYKHFPHLDEWIAGDNAPTLPQLEQFARATYTPIGFFFLGSPPSNDLPLPDFRTVKNAKVATPSSNLLDTLALCEQRQDWYRSHAVETGEDPIPFVGSLKPTTPIERAAETISAALRFDVDERGSASGWTEALRLMSDRVEDAGILLMISGIVGSNTHRPLDPEEFRGFVLIDPYAPLIFINGADAKAAQIFTLCHELAHVWLGQSALSSPDLASTPSVSAGAGDIENWCNRVAAEMLIPKAMLERDYDADRPLQVEVQRLARRYKVSALVVLRRLFDTQRLSRSTFRKAYAEELNVVREKAGSSGGNYYNSQPVRTSKRFARAVIRSAVEGQTLYRDAYRLLSVSTHSTFEGLGRALGVF